MATKAKKSKKKTPDTTANDGVYLLKLVLYTIIGTQWVWFESGTTFVPIPLGLLVGILFAMHEHFRVDRKVEFAVLLAAMLVGYVAKIGIFITL